MFLVFVAGCMAIGFVAGEVGANKWAVSSIIPFLKELPPTLGVLCSYLAGVLTNLLLTPFAATVLTRRRRTRHPRWHHPDLS